MYENFFGFKERPFQLVPNPAYLFLSKCHEEALAHLNYAVSQGDGFVEITGEVGTGKTTLCRAFLENLARDIEVAYIFNPKLNSVQLLKAINDELGVRSNANNTKTLIDNLNFFLMEKKAEGKKVILVIDEAQNLSKKVLEQLRLLSNLETTTKKLLQIILIGQPELSEILDSRELRQLAQRITLSYHLVPLTFKETREYIRHRIRIASRKSGIKFNRSAIRAVYKYSAGTPRLINIACDRAILTAYGLNQCKITGSIARVSIRELATRGDIKRRSFRERTKPILIFSALCLILLAAILSFDIRGLFKSEQSKKPVSSQSEPSDIKASVKPKADKKLPGEKETGEFESAETPVNPDEKLTDDSNIAVSEPPGETAQVLEEFLGRMDARSSRHMALKAAVEMWNHDPIINPYLDDMSDNSAFFRLGAKQNGLLIYHIEGDFELVKKLNLPAVLEMNSPAGASPGYLTLTKADDRTLTLRGGNEEEIVVEAESNDVELYWSGTAYVPWKNFFDYSGSIPRNAPEDSVITLKMILQEIGFKDIEVTPFYDEKSQEAVEEIQEKHGVNVDGVVGPLTKIILYNEMESLIIPHLIEN
ncbi:ExeA family protein [Desulfonema magnum]|uniref:AAA ATPase domain-containing protein, peptidoglycan binding domain-containing n=1 Tax=Desulfonema magnum TaxID=45655 RepID=A0A975GK17_9BACT|nr:ExeA family protein [Desulfonema magnum]QTA84045.1 AAA ATPase domain-containing protein, peptidoglycan binding domain-containing [Desulfonema magnum]